MKKQKHVISPDAWAHMNKFRGVDTARVQRLTQDQARRLCNVCDPDFRQLVEAALLTAARAGDFDAQSGSVSPPPAPGSDRLIQ